jgi:hypothetical protein
MTVLFLGWPKKKTVKIKQNTILIWNKINKSHSKNDRPFFGMAQKNDGQKQTKKDFLKI